MQRWLPAGPPVFCIQPALSHRTPCPLCSCLPRPDRLHRPGCWPRCSSGWRPAWHWPGVSAQGATAVVGQQGWLRTWLLSRLPPLRRHSQQRAPWPRSSQPRLSALRPVGTVRSAGVLPVARGRRVGKVCEVSSGMLKMVSEGVDGQEVSCCTWGRREAQS